MRQKIFFLKRFDSELLYVQGSILKSFQRFSLTLSVSTNNSKYLDFFRTGPSRFEALLFTLFRKPKDSIVWICKIKDFKSLKEKEGNGYSI